MSTPSNQERYYGESVIFSHCRKLSTLESLQKFGTALAQNGLRPLPNRSNQKLIKADNIDVLIEAGLQKRDGSPSQGGIVLRGTFPIYVEKQTASDARFHLMYTEYREGRNGILFSGDGSTHENVAAQEERLANEILQISYTLYDLAGPRYGYILNDLEEEYPWEDTAVANLEIPALTWVNFFGPEYVSKFGYDFFANIPGYSIQELPDGGIRYQSRPTFQVENKKAYTQWQNEVKAYLSQYNIPIYFRFEL